MLNKDINFLVNEFGQAATLRKVTSGSYDPNTGTAGSTTVDYSVKTYMAQYTLLELTVDTIVRGDRKALLSAFDTSGVSLPPRPARRPRNVMNLPKTYETLGRQQIWP